VAKSLAANVEGPMYRDLRGGVFEIRRIREKADRSIERVETERICAATTLKA
jgi:hypothetical protein